MASDRLPAQSASSTAGAWLPCSTTSSRLTPDRSSAPVTSAPHAGMSRLSHRPRPSQRDVAVVAAALRRVRDGPDDRFPGLGRLDDLIDHAQGLGPLQAARLALVLRGEARLDLVQLVRWHAGDGAAVQDADRRYRAH